MVLTIGTACFGILIGYITYRTLARTTDAASISDLAAVIGAVGGGAVTAIVQPQTENFGWYAIGLLVGFIAYGALFWKLKGGDEFAMVMGLSHGATEQNRGPNAPPRPGS